MDGASYSIAEAAVALNLSAKTIRRYIKSGKLSSVKVATKFGEEYRITGLPEALKQEKPEEAPPQPEKPATSEPVSVPLDAYHLYQENIRLAAQIGAASERIRHLEEQVKLLQPPRRLPWWKRLFRIG